MKTTTVKTLRLFALCASILSVTATFSADNDDTPPKKPKARVRFDSYSLLFKDISDISSQKMKAGAEKTKINAIVKAFIKNNFEGVDPTIENLATIKTRLTKAKVNDHVAKLIRQSLDFWQANITSKALTSSSRRSVMLEYKRLEKTNEQALAPVADLPNIPDLINHLNSKIIGEESEMQNLSASVHIHYTTLKLNQDSITAGLEPQHKKENILICGPTGSGKTASVAALAEKLKKPFFEGDASGFTRTGYVGESASSLIEGLVTRAKEKVTDDMIEGSAEYIDEVVRQVENGVVFIDELDKIREADSSGRDITGGDVQAELLKLSEGKKIAVKFKKSPFREDVYEIDTSKILFIAGGAFTNLSKKDKGYTYSPDDFVKAGYKPELLGRFGSMVFLEGISEDKLLKILESPENSPLKANLLILEHYGIHAHFTNNAKKILAKRALERNTGVRGLASMVREVTKKIIIDNPIPPAEAIRIDSHYLEEIFPVETLKEKEPTLAASASSKKGQSEEEDPFEEYIKAHPNPPDGMFA
jgi:ATP-dependent Clp protease ATP-binding subunit ClpX